MKFFKFLFWLPVLVIITVFAAYNSEPVNFNLWPFLLEAKISGSLAIIALILFGYIIAKIDSWFSYSPMRRALSSQKKQNKMLGKKQKELEGTISGLKENITNLKAMNHMEPEKKSFMTRLKEKFKRQ